MSQDMLALLIKSLGETIYMVSISMVLAVVIGIPLGVLLVTTSKHHVLEAVAFNRVLAGIVNAVRSIPFIILMVAIIPLTRLIVGSSIGTTAAMVPLTIAAIPFIGRQVETSLKEVEYGVIEAALSMGATPGQIIWRVLLPEALPGNHFPVDHGCHWFGGVLSYGWRHRRRRPGGFGNPLWVPAVPRRCHAGYDHHPCSRRQCHPTVW